MSPDEPPRTVSDHSASVGACESCGDEAVVVEAVRRLYLVPATDTEPERYDAADVTERWCFVCRTHYPHELLDAAPEG